MKIMRGEDELFEVLVYLTRAEAAELQDAVQALLQNFEEPGYHAHVSSSDYQTEFTLAPHAGESA